jgi:CRISPR-associated protein Cas2
MSTGERRYYLVSYDITDPRRLAEVHRYLKKRALPLQYSVFLAHANERVIGAMLSDLADLIRPSTDDVRIYPLPSECQAVTLGSQSLPHGVFIFPDAALPSLMASGAESDDTAL